MRPRTRRRRREADSPSVLETDQRWSSTPGRGPGRSGSQRALESHRPDCARELDRAGTCLRSRAHATREKIADRAEVRRRSAPNRAGRSRRLPRRRARVRSRMRVGCGYDYEVCQGDQQRDRNLHAHSTCKRPTPWPRLPARACPLHSHSGPVLAGFGQSIPKSIALGKEVSPRSELSPCGPKRIAAAPLAKRDRRGLR